MAISSIGAFWAVAALLIAVPGADWSYVIGTVLSGRPVRLAVSGIVLGYAGITVVVAAGVGVFYLSMGSFARRILDGRPAVARAIARGSGAAMIVLGALLLAEHLLL